MVDSSCFGVFFSILCFFFFVNSVVGPAFMAVEYTPSSDADQACGYALAYGPMFYLSVSEEYFLDSLDDPQRCYAPENLVADITEYNYEIFSDVWSEETFTGQYVLWAFGALASLLTLISSCFFCQATCTIEGISDSKHHVTAVLCILAAVSGGAVVLVWNFVAVPDIKDNLLTNSLEHVFNEQCFSQILLIAGIFFVYCERLHCHEAKGA
jgi:hypothetical protein